MKNISMRDGSLFSSIRSIFFELEKLGNKDRELILSILNGLTFPYEGIKYFTFSINESIPHSEINDAIYIFVDEAGDMDFSAKGSRHYMFNFLVKTRPFQLHEHIANFRYELIERNLDPFIDRKLDIESFHAHNDNKHIKKRMFEIISTFGPDAVKVYSYILEKPKVHPEKRKEATRFYIDNLAFATSQLLEKLAIQSNFIIITDRLPVKKMKNALLKALKTGIETHSKEIGKPLSYSIHNHCSASSSNLQIIDYIGWAIYRKYEHGDDTYYEMIDQYLVEEAVMTKNRIEEHY